MDLPRNADKGHYARKLSEEEVARLDNDRQLVSKFKQNKLESDARKNWDLFYKRNSTKFFKDRHWITREFEELGVNVDDDENKKTVILEVGCGVGNFIFPLLEVRSNFFIYACDFSKRAIEFVKANPLYDESVCHAFECDLTEDDLMAHVAPNTVDIVSMIFVLSAIHPLKMVAALENIFKALKPGGMLLFRDYGLYDQAMLRFAPGHKLNDCFYVRQDGTRAYYFSEGNLCKLCTDCGFVVENCKYVQRQTVNKREGIDVPRIFVQGKFSKPKLQMVAASAL